MNETAPILALLIASSACSSASTTRSASTMDDAAAPSGAPGASGTSSTPSPGDAASAARPEDAGAGSTPGATIGDGDAALQGGSGGDGASAAVSADAASGQTIGTGDINAPANGPGPSLASTVGGAAFTLVKNWDFGTSGTIRGTSDLVAEFQFHDQFGTIANGTHYGGVIVAPTQASAIGGLDSSLNLPNNAQPVEDPSRPTRIYTADSIQSVLQPLKASQTTCSVSSHDVGAGSLVAKWMPAHGGKLLGQDILWETRIRLVKPCASYWFALWTAGNQWNGGAEMDTPESFGSSNVFPPAHLFHVNSVGGTDSIDYSNWGSGLMSAGIPGGTTDLTQYHVWTWLYRKDDTYVSWFDGYEVQHGSIHWTLGGTPSGTPINMTFLFDFTWGNTAVSSVDPSGVSASSVQMTYEMDYSRVYLR